ncbi:NlpC/P60 family protein [Nocardia veterana]|uniref:DUF4226 domain-containing protein n=1 Tax=Nocardia veterana TaxID=132249 RepID=A0A7X6LZV8_9NOCA|nr:NlpC/P60 family protein [Nocardia veterana]NKY87226.1 DUF4226 domain-containing protein [Nocardia veterana]
MTTPAEVDHGATASDPQEGADPNAEDAQTSSAELRPLHQRDEPRPRVAPSVAPGGPRGDPNGPAPSGSPAAPAPAPPAAPPGPPPVSTGAGVVAPAGTPPVQPGPAGAAPVVAPSGPVAAPGPVPGQPAASPIPGIDPDLLATAVPAAMMGGAMALSMLPMLASALAGLGGGNGAGAGGSGADPQSGLTPQAQQAIEALKELKAAYGDGDSEDADTGGPGKKKLTGDTGDTGGTGATANQVKARRLFQRNAARAFNTLDNDLVRYITKHAGKHKVDKRAVRQLLRDVDAKLGELGPIAYTRAGQQKVHRILEDALHEAQKIVSGGQTNSADTAKEIDRLTAQYLNNLYGKQTPAGAGGTSAAGQRAVQVALQQVGKPYVWGAEGPSSFDCSGLMQYSAGAAGAKLPRTAAEQYRQLPKVAPNQIRPGDLIFPAAQFNGGNPQHVMMYIGDGKCVAAPKPGQTVRVESLPKSYAATRWASQ